MSELIFPIENVNPTIVLGTNNSHVQKIKTYFPKVKIIARGQQIKGIGEADDLNFLEQKLNQIIEHVHVHNSLSEVDIERIIFGSVEETNLPNETIIHGVNGKAIKARTPNQQLLVDALHAKDMVFAIGPAGTGKTFTGIAMAVKALKQRKVRRLILTRPAVEAGENLGFLPGDLKEKLDPYMQPLYDALRDMIPADKLTTFIEKEIIQIAPLAFMRGRTLDDAFVILDEAQNTTEAQMKMFLTRMGMDATFMITGDPGQIDLPSRQKSGLVMAIDKLNTIEDIGMVYLNEGDVVRHPLVKKIIEKL